MDTLRLLLLSSAVASVCGGQYSEMSEPKCEEFDVDVIDATEGEALRIVPSVLTEFWRNFTVEDFTWYRHGSQDEYFSSDQEERIHHRGAELFLLDLHTSDSGLYVTRHNLSSEETNCYYTEVTVHPARNRKLQFTVRVPDRNPWIPCLQRIESLCMDEGGNLTWYRNFTLLHGKHDKILRLNNVTKADEGMYTCVCTFTYNHRVYNSTASRMFQIEEPSVRHTPQIITPTSDVQIVDAGTSVTLNCTAYCGRNLLYGCSVGWFIDGESARDEVGYTMNVDSAIVQPSQHSSVTAVLTIHRVSARDFQAKFQCRATNSYKSVNQTLTLKPRESLTPLITAAVCVVFLCVLAAVMVKCFAIELALLFRRCFVHSRKEDGKQYDAYVVYQTQSADKATEQTLCNFVTNVLPSVLEKKCNYRLFIHSRDDIPGEDRLELVESRIRLSRRLIVILTPGPDSGSEVLGQKNASSENLGVSGYDWQVGLHEALVQREMSVIMIQLGHMQSYTHLPPGLQHLVRKSAPIRWREGSRGAAKWNSRFWKRVRYMMPAAPAGSPTPSVVV
ncbi:interleukin-1 receptor-like 1 isoform X1 [Myripristis murdjan]|uniref:interleukin-1 receptor-like 1 isoform X1 n=1 Tax=Myripristis murdjan TaxID=586833 RepID=UPI0011762A6E|nr:interleukin-1 receptor-like 1 isoform X1 [Myripristis murdjan]